MADTQEVKDLKARKEKGEVLTPEEETVLADAAEAPVEEPAEPAK